MEAVVTEEERQALVSACLNPGTSERSTTCVALAAALEQIDRWTRRDDATMPEPGDALAVVLQHHRERVGALYMAAAEWVCEMHTAFDG
jgi:hypothetical protein